MSSFTHSFTLILIAFGAKPQSQCIGDVGTICIPGRGVYDVGDKFSKRWLWIRHIITDVANSHQETTPRRRKAYLGAVAAAVVVRRRLEVSRKIGSSSKLSGTLQSSMGARWSSNENGDQEAKDKAAASVADFVDWS